MTQLTKLTNSLSRKKRTLVIITIAALVLIVIIIGVFFAMQPQRTVANFCSVAKEEKSNFQAGTNYSTLLDTFKKFDAVAPNQVRSDTSLVVNGYQSIVNDPSRATATELGIANSQSKISSYISKNCPDY